MGIRRAAVQRYAVAIGRWCSSVASAALILVAAAAPARADDTPELPAIAVGGPYASRAEACEAALGNWGPCASYRAVATLRPPRGWTRFEIGRVADRSSLYRSTTHFALVAEVGGHWFASYAGSNGPLDTEFFPPCPRDSEADPLDHLLRSEHSCTPFHRDRPSSYEIPQLSIVAGMIVLRYPFADRAVARVEVCAVDHVSVPRCTGDLIAVLPTRGPIRRTADLLIAAPDRDAHGGAPAYGLAVVDDVTEPSAIATVSRLSLTEPAGP